VDLVSAMSLRRPVSPRLLAAVLVFLAVQSTAVASLGTPLLPTVQRVEQVSLAASQWTLTITLLAGAVATPLMGRLGDGRLRRLTTVGAVAVMLAGCVLSALPVGFPAFLAGRALQGAGLGLVPLATAVARDDLPAERSRPGRSPRWRCWPPGPAGSSAFGIRWSNCGCSGAGRYWPPTSPCS